LNISGEEKPEGKLTEKEQVPIDEYYYD